MAIDSIRTRPTLSAVSVTAGPQTAHRRTATDTVRSLPLTYPNTRVHFLRRVQPRPPRCTSGEGEEWLAAASGTVELNNELAGQAGPDPPLRRPRPGRHQYPRCLPQPSHAVARPLLQAWQSLAPAMEKAWARAAGVGQLSRAADELQYHRVAGRPGDRVLGSVSSRSTRGRVPVQRQRVGGLNRGAGGLANRPHAVIAQSVGAHRLPRRQGS